ncbi:hypothetical protein [Chryseobacterium sp.]|uniref:hypothetical protein n=1 Tax=Chryseobacterium sp. TaxID=1871047 RepID=UPI0028998B22|nr:hypothetical protein [Chryseobacterium sp.]
MKTIIPILIILIFSSCGRNDAKKNNSHHDDRKASCTCLETIKKDTTIFATDVRLKKETENDILVFHCASVLTGTASVNDMDSNNEYCETMYDIQCISSVDSYMQLSENFQYFTGKLQSQDLFFEDLKRGKDYYFELSSAPDGKIISISRLNIN